MYPLTRSANSLRDRASRGLDREGWARRAAINASFASMATPEARTRTTVPLAWDKHENSRDQRAAWPSARYGWITKRKVWKPNRGGYASVGVEHAKSWLPATTNPPI